MTDTVLSDDEVERIRQLPVTMNGNIKPQPGVVLTAQDRNALCATVRALRAEQNDLQSSVTYWHAEALLNHFCSEHASNRRQLGHYCTVCAKPFTMAVPQGEPPPKYKDLIAENTALREQLARSQTDIDKFSTLADERHDLLSEERRRNDGLREHLGTLEQSNQKLTARNVELRHQLAQVTQECDGLRQLLVRVAIPYEGLVVDTESRKWIAPSIWKQIESSVTAIRKSLKEQPSANPNTLITTNGS